MQIARCTDDKGDGPGPGQFKTFDPGTMKFDHTCPRCGYEFNEAKPAAADPDA